MKKTILAAAAAFAAALCMQASPREASEVLSGILPAPGNITVGTGVFNVKGANVLFDKALDGKTEKAVVKFADALSLTSGKTCRFKAVTSLRTLADGGAAKGIVFVQKTGLGSEEYRIRVSGKSVIVEASARAGFLYAIQTLKQMLPVAVYGKVTAANEDWTLPCCTIEDRPRFEYRGMLLDCGRHFFPVEVIHKYLDIMAVYKLNRFHWHLTEDQGWRIEIKKYPRLTEVGAWRSGTQIGKDRSSSDGIPHGGFYTQDQIREIVAYADELGITIVPEIDMPGHMMAALASYPELGFKDSQPYKVWTRWGVCKKVLNVGKQETISFLEDVVNEAADLFPGEYFCIGGDECSKDEWESSPECQAKIRELGLVSDDNASAENRLQNYVMAHIQKCLAAKGKKVLGADEMLEGGIVEDDMIIMAWRGTKRGYAAARKGIDVLMVPKPYCFMDFYQLKDRSVQPLAIGGYLPLSQAYSFNPTEGLDAEAAKHIKGLQAQMWTEYVATPEHIEYMLFPRLFALSEVQWTSQEKKDYDRLLGSIENHQKKILDLLGYNYCKVSE